MSAEKRGAICHCVGHGVHVMLTVLKDGNGGDGDDENRVFSHENFACTPFLK